MKGKKIISAVLGFVLAFSLIIPTYNSTDVTKANAAYSVSNKEINKFFGQSAIVGNSVGLGLKNYFSSKKSGYLGNPKMLVWGCYSFLNDFNRNTDYMIHYNGQPLRAKDAVKASGAKHVFINMGANDFNTSQHNIFNNYKKYVSEIKKTNPGVDIFILATTPTRRESGLLNNYQINKLNNNMKIYCKSKADMYYIDINTPLKDGSGYLRSSYSSDGYVHLTSSAYRIWTDTMVKYVKKHLRNQKKAKSLVKKAGKTLHPRDYQNAVNAVNKLAKSKCKSSLKKKLKATKKKIENNKNTTSTTENKTTEPATDNISTSSADS